MINQRSKFNQLTDLGKHAETYLEQEARHIPDTSSEEIRKLVHELRMHQIELEMQNDELHRAQCELVESRNRCFDLYQFAPVGFAIMNDKGMILDANLTLASMFGISRNAMLKKNLTEFIIPDDQDIFYRYRHQIKSKQRDTCILRMKGREGKSFWVEMDTIYSATDDPCDYRLQTVISDITGREHAEKKLTESEAKFRNYVESAPDGIFVVDKKGCYVDTNEAGCQLTGYSRDELMGKELLTLIHPDDRQVASRHFSCTAGVRHELRFIRKDGTVRFCVVDTVKLADKHFLGFVKDITEFRRREENQRQAEKMQAVGQLAGGIAHDFNNQLGGILGYADMLREEAEGNPVIVRYADNIINCVKCAADLSSQLLAFSRKGKYINTEVDIHYIVSDVVNLLKHSIDRKIEIHQELRANPSTTMGDPTQLQNAFLNLGLNARDAMPDGGNLIFATDIIFLDKEYCEAQPLFEIGPGQYLKLSVTDTGLGMDRNTMARIFEPFYTTKETGKGTGMGLAAVYGAVKNHKGSILVYSEVGSGTTFELSLPIKSGCSVPKKQKDLQQKSIVGAAHVLLIEDEETIRSVAKRMLEKLGHTVTVCSNGAEAVDLYRKQWQSINLVVLDVIMPEMDGEEAFSVMRKINPDVLALVSSGYCIDGKARNMIENGARGFIQKPYRIGELSVMISEVLETNFVVR